MIEQQLVKDEKADEEGASSSGKGSTANTIQIIMAMLFMFVVITESDTKGHLEMGNGLMAYIGTTSWSADEDSSTMEDIEEVENIH
jgi:hypothetical protein